MKTRKKQNEKKSTYLIDGARMLAVASRGTPIGTIDTWHGETKS
jgi:hypothetical protein